MYDCWMKFDKLTEFNDSGSRCFSSPLVSLRRSFRVAGTPACRLPSFGYQQSILSVYTMVLFYFLSPPKWDRGYLLLFCELNEQCDLISFAAATKIIENPRE